MPAKLFDHVLDTSSTARRHREQTGMGFARRREVERDDADFRTRIGFVSSLGKSLEGDYVDILSPTGARLTGGSAATR